MVGGATVMETREAPREALFLYPREQQVLEATCALLRRLESRGFECDRVTSTLERVFELRPTAVSHGLINATTTDGAGSPDAMEEAGLAVGHCSQCPETQHFAKLEPIYYMRKKKKY